MPTYPMFCTKCKHKEELVQSIKLDLPTKCPKCGKESYEQDLGARFGTYNGILDYCGEPKTVGQQAERNTKKLSGAAKEAYKASQKSAQPKRKERWWKKYL